MESLEKLKSDTYLGLPKGSGCSTDELTDDMNAVATYLRKLPEQIDALVTRKISLGVDFSSVNKTISELKTQNELLSNSLKTLTGNFKVFAFIATILIVLLAILQFAS